MIKRIQLFYNFLYFKASNSGKQYSLLNLKRLYKECSETLYSENIYNANVQRKGFNLTEKNGLNYGGLSIEQRKITRIS